MKNIILKNGIFAGLIVSGFMAAMTLYMKANPEMEPSMVVGFAGMIVAFSFIIIGISSCDFRNKRFNKTRCYCVLEKQRL